MSKATLVIVHERKAKSTQSTHLTTVYRAQMAYQGVARPVYTIEVTVDADSYDFQSHVQVRCLDGGQWAPAIVSLLGSEMKSAGDGLYAKAADLEADRDYALRLACAVLGIG